MKKTKIEKLVVGKGKTTGNEKIGWTKQYFELAVSIEDLSEVELAKANISGLLDGWLTQPSEPKLPREPKLPVQLPQLYSEESGKLPWKTYQTKELCKPDEAGWIFSNTPGAEVLSQFIENQGNSTEVQIGGYMFRVRFSGNQRQFIGRVPVQKKVQ